MHTEAWLNEATDALKEGDANTALTLCRDILQQHPMHPQALQLGGTAHVLQGDHLSAVFWLKLAVALNETSIARMNLGTSYKALGLLDRAEQQTLRALEINPGNANIWINLGAILEESEQYAGALRAYRTALQLSDDGRAHSGIVSILTATGKLKWASQYGLNVLARIPDQPILQFNTGQALLGTNQPAHALAHLEWRKSLGSEYWNASHTPPPDLPLWDGSLQSGLRLLIIEEQGMGDMIQYARHAAKLKQAGLKLTWMARQPLLPLLKDSDIFERVRHDQPGNWYEYDAWVHAGSLEYHSPQDVGFRHYLHANQSKLDTWYSILQAHKSLGRPLIGLNWSGNPQHRNDHERSVPTTALLEAIRDYPQYTFIALQQPGVACLPDNVHVVAQHIHDFSDTAALLSLLDGFLTVDSAPAHLAGALGIPAVVLLGRKPDTRWGTSEANSRLYPTLKLVRRGRFETWQPALRRAFDTIVPHPHQPEALHFQKGSSTMQPDFTVIVTTHHRSTLLQRALQSILAQTFQHFEIILVSDEGSAATHHVAGQYLREQDKFLRMPGIPGPAASRNLGMQLAQGRFVLFLDDDDTWHPDFLAHLIQRPELTQHAIFYVNCHVIQECRSEPSIPVKSVQIADHVGIQAERIEYDNFIPSNCIVLPAEAAAWARFDPQLRCLEDWDFLIQLHRKRPFVHLPIFGPYVHIDEEEVGRNSGNALARAVDWMSIYARWPVQAAHLREIRLKQLESFGFSLPPEAL
ncbi:glycosyltransferase [Burkholderiaceae bacterium DAT-1]|nr:glycosyltransferase [Burkholderiaceae bacterium DAT-1]